MSGWGTEAVERAAAQAWREVWSDARPYAEATEAEKDECRSTARSILEAAAHRAICPTTYGEMCDGYCEPAGVSDEAVEAAAKTMSVLWENYTASMRTALEAAAPFMQPQVVASRQAVAKPLHDAMHGRLACAGSPNCYIWDEAYKAADALLAAGVFREPPTREAVREEFRVGLNRALCNGGHPDTGWSPSAEVDRITDAVLNLLGGATGINSDLYTCTGCGVRVIGHETCGDPTRPECAGGEK